MRSATLRWNRNTDTDAGVELPVSVQNTSNMKRFATPVAVALVVFITALPAAAACCVIQPAGGPASMHASMPCCAETCNITTPKTNRDHDVTLSPASSPLQPLQATLAVFPTAVVSSPLAVAGDPQESAAHGSAPPTFVANHQFRI